MHLIIVMLAANSKNNVKKATVDYFENNRKRELDDTEINLKTDSPNLTYQPPTSQYTRTFAAKIGYIRHNQYTRNRLEIYA